jgi:hypothetical protein
LFKKNYGEEGFYNKEEVDLTNEEHLEPTRIEEGEDEELRQREIENSGIVRTIEVSNVNPPVVPTILSIQSNQNHQNIQSIITSSSTSAQTRSLVSSMEDEMRLPILRRWI